MKQRIETLKEEVRKDLYDDPFGDNESYKEKYEEIKKIENDPLLEFSPDKDYFFPTKFIGFEQFIDAPVGTEFMVKYSHNRNSSLTNPAFYRRLSASVERDTPSSNLGFHAYQTTPFRIQHIHF